MKQEPRLLKQIFEQALKAKASDIHLAVGDAPIFRVNGRLYDSGIEQVLSREILLAEIRSILEGDLFDKYLQKHGADVSYQLDNDEARFRIDVYWKFNEPAIAARTIPNIIPSLEELKAPEAVYDFVELSQGLVLVTGPTGAGKSTLIASMIDHINHNKSKHIITLEDPIEFVFKQDKSVISQRQLNTDFLTFKEGLKHVFRQDPDVVLIGEMRDYPTIQTALTLAETGHVVFATLHTNGASQTVERIVNSFPAQQQNQIRLQLSLVLKGVVSQLLLPSVDGSLLAVQEIMVQTPAVSNVIRDGQTEQLQNIIYSSMKDKMIDLDRRLRELIDQGVINPNVAYEHAHNKKDFEDINNDFSNYSDETI